MKSKKILLIVFVVALILFAYVNYTKRVQLATELKKLSVKMEQLQGGNNPENVAQAQAIINKVKRHIVIADGVQPTVATIVDVNLLKARNDFYKVAKNGDHLVVTSNRAILYDPDKDIILDVVPVQLQSAAEASASSAAKK